MGAFVVFLDRIFDVFHLVISQCTKLQRKKQRKAQDTISIITINQLKRERFS